MRTLPTRSFAVATAGLAALAVLVITAAAPAATGRAALAAAHKCLVMTGSGGPAVTNNFNPPAGGPRVQKKLQPVRRRRPAEQRVRTGRDVRAAHRRAERRQQDDPLARTH